MNRDFVLNILFLLAVNLLIKPFFIFGIDRAVQNEVGPAAYGMYFTLFNFTYLFQIVIDFGIQNFNNRNIAQHPHLLTKYFNHVFVLKLVLSLVYAALVLSSAAVLGYSWAYFKVLAVLVLNQIFISFTLYFRSNISGLQRYFTDSLLSVLDKLLLILFCSVLLYANPFEKHFQIEWFVYAQTAAYATTAFIAFLQVYKQLKIISLRWHKAFQYWLLRASLPYALIVFLMSVYTRIDGVMIEQLAGATEVGLYASAYRLLDAATMVGLLFSGLLLPMYARQLKEGVSVVPLTRLGVTAIWAISAAVAAGCFVFRFDLMNLLYHGATDYSGELLGWLMLSFPAVCLMYIFGALLLSKANLRPLNWLFAVSVVFNIFCNFILIPSFKALGGAIATLLTQYLVAIALILIAKRAFNWQIDWKLLIRIGLFAVLSGLLFYSVKNSLFYLDNGYNWLFQFGFSTILCVVLSFLLRLIDVKSIIQVLKK